ncbi:hypothetical protein BJX66DRAFT_20514 [Aspergillus keveii]|uniref:Uncharacterized protein n=1 Tax=Aspergillus keveii TaxID=714993 RepID=A0ABR4FUF0_9EURO
MTFTGPIIAPSGRTFTCLQLQPKNKLAHLLAWLLASSALDVKGKIRLSSTPLELDLPLGSTSEETTHGASVKQKPTRQKI